MSAIHTSPAPKVKVCTDLFRQRHDKEPRGYAYWVFRIGGSYESGFLGLYSAALAWAKREAAARAASIITVLP